MADPVVGGLGLLGLISLFETCNKAYDVFVRSARNLGKDYYRISVLLEVERQKLCLWGQYLGISPSQQCRLLRAETVGTQQTVVRLLECIKALLDDIRVIMIRYDVRILQADHDTADSAPAPPIEINLGDLNLQDLRTCPAVQIAETKRRETETFVRSSTSRLKKIKWALGDSAKLNRLVDDLRLINENLWVSLPVNKWLALAKGLPSVVLPEINDQVMLKAVESNAQGSQTTKLLAACSDLRRVALASGNELSPSFGEELRWPPSCVQTKKLIESGETSIPSHTHMAIVKDSADIATRVILEYRYVDRDFSEEEKQVIRSRIKALAVLLSSSKSPELGLLKCIGFFKDDHLVIERYGLLLEIPGKQSQQRLHIPTSLGAQQSHPYSLYEYINTKKSPLLGDRFKIASVLCNIVLQIHASNWLHKAIRSSNILFLDQTQEFPSEHDRINDPFIAGFDFSRPDRPAADSLEGPLMRRTQSENVYRHPALWASSAPKPRFRKEYDIFALGVVLLEIGNWKLAEKCCDPRKDLESPEAWKAFLLKCAEPLGHRCGRIYQEVVQTCLKGPFFENNGVDVNLDPGMADLDIKRSFLFDVVYQLAKCYA